MKSRLDSQLELLNTELIEMGSLCEEMIHLSHKSLNAGNEYLEEARKRELEIDHMEGDIENLCMKLLLKQQPVAKDLRAVSSALKMISDMERIGDQALDVIEIADYVTDCDEESKRMIEAMSEAAGKMVSDSVEAYVRKDEVLAKAVMDSDDIVDNLFDGMKARLIEVVSSKGVNGEMYIDLIMIAKYYERIADHATNIAEWVLYSITGKKVPDGKDS